MEGSISVMWVTGSRELVQLADRLSADGNIRTAHIFPSASEALSARTRWGAQVCLVGEKLPDATGVHFMRKAIRETDELRFILIGEHADGRTAHEALMNGADGLLSTPPMEDQVLLAISCVARGDLSIPAPILTAWVRHLRQLHAPHMDGLSEREQEVLHLLAQGLTYKAIGEELHISAFTVKNHVHRLMAKLGVRTRVEAVRRFLHYRHSVAGGGRSSL